MAIAIEEIARSQELFGIIIQQGCIIALFALN
jgi:hypothetical protein